MTPSHETSAEAQVVTCSVTSQTLQELQPVIRGGKVWIIEKHLSYITWSLNDSRTSIGAYKCQSEYTLQRFKLEWGILP